MNSQALHTLRCNISGDSGIRENVKLITLGGIYRVIVRF